MKLSSTDSRVVTIQPFREEIARIIAIYLADGAPRQLNLSSKERATLLHALANTTHPSTFRNVVHTVEWTLRHQAHPNFIRWTICNGNRPRVIFARGLGVAGILGGFVAAILITLSNAGRAYRVLSAIGFFIGVATMICAWKGMCIVSHSVAAFQSQALTSPRSFTVCTTDIFGHGNSSRKTTSVLHSTWARAHSIPLQAPTVTKTNHGSLSTKSVMFYVRSWIARFGFRSRLFDKSRIRYSCKPSLGV